MIETSFTETEHERVPVLTGRMHCSFDCLWIVPRVIPQQQQQKQALHKICFWRNLNWEIGYLVATTSLILSPQCLNLFVFNCLYEAEEVASYIIIEAFTECFVWNQCFNSPAQGKKVNSCTHANISNLYSLELPALLKDIYDVLQLLKTLQIPESTILCTLDIESLYSNIPHGLEALNPFWDNN